MKKTFILCLLALLCCTMQAQTARQVLDAAAAKLQKGGVSANFKATTYKGLKASGTAAGTIQIQGSKFKIASNGMTTWYDGKSQWTMISGSGEVNLSQPTAAEASRMNPYSFINLYKNGYNSSMKTTTYEGRTCKEITLVATGKGVAYPRILVIVDSNNTPVNVRVKDSKGNWMRFAVSNVQTGKRFSDATFRFDKKQYPKIEIIDLR